MISTEYYSDKLNDLIRRQLTTAFEMNMPSNEWMSIVRKLEELLIDHYENPRDSRMSRVFPGTLSGELFTKLPLARAFRLYDNKYHVTQRQFVPPSFDEVRHILNIAQIIEVSSTLKMITFDGDETLYSDGQFFADEGLACFICCLLRDGVKIGLVTAAGYEYDVDRYEGRLKGLFEYFRKHHLKKEALENFFVMGGECNYFMRVNGDTCRLEAVDRSEWVVYESDPEEQTRMLDIAEGVLRNVLDEFNLRARLIRKKLAVGIVSGGADMRGEKPHGSGSTKLRTEILDEACIRVKKALRAANIQAHYCAFNGGNDVFVDCGNKRVGLERIQKYFNGLLPSECIHVGDQFYKTGNDFQARSCSTCIWVKGPEETKSILRLLLKQKGLIAKAFLYLKEGFEVSENNISNHAVQSAVVPDLLRLTIEGEDFEGEKIIADSGVNSLIATGGSNSPVRGGNNELSKISSNNNFLIKVESSGNVAGSSGLKKTTSNGFIRRVNSKTSVFDENRDMVPTAKLTVISGMKDGGFSAVLLDDDEDDDDVITDDENFDEHQPTFSSQ